MRDAGSGERQFLAHRDGDIFRLQYLVGRRGVGDYNEWLMGWRLCFAVILIGCGVVPARAQILPPGAMVKQLATGYAFTEGPVYDNAGGVLFTNLIFSNQTTSDIVRYNIATGI